MRSLPPSCPLRLAGACAGAVLMLSGCAGVPSQEMSDARVALDAARQANAAQLAPAATSRAEMSLGSATEALRAGNYDAARERAAAAHDEANLARRLATLVAATNDAIRAAQAAGRPWQGASELLARAQDASGAGDTARAIAVAERARALVP